MRGLSTLVKQFIKLFFAKLTHFILHAGVKQKDFCIFSNDCWGAELYRWMKLQYNTPFVGLMLMAPCYIKFLKNPRYYINSKVQFIDSSKYPGMNQYRELNHMYPLGLIDDIEIHFLHYNSNEEALEKWEKRKRRINWDNICIKFSTDKDFATIEHLKEFEDLPYKRKVCFSKYDYNEFPSVLKVPLYLNDGAALFKVCMKDFSIINWLNKGIFNTSLTGKILYYILIR